MSSANIVTCLPPLGYFGDSSRLSSNRTQARFAESPDEGPASPRPRGRRGPERLGRAGHLRSLSEEIGAATSRGEPEPLALIKGHHGGKGDGSKMTFGSH